jgi:hypothetical protein
LAPPFSSRWRQLSNQKKVLTGIIVKLTANLYYYFFVASGAAGAGAGVAAGAAGAGASGGFTSSLAGAGFSGALDEHPTAIATTLITNTIASNR